MRKWIGWPWMITSNSVLAQWHLNFSETRVLHPYINDVFKPVINIITRTSLTKLNKPLRKTNHWNHGEPQKLQKTSTRISNFSLNEQWKKKQIKQMTIRKDSYYY